MDWAAQVLLYVSSLLGVQELPSGMNSWEVEQQWVETAGVHSLVLISRTVSEECSSNPSFKLRLPRVIHGAHEIIVDGVVVARFGDPTFATAYSFFASPHIPCDLIAAGNIVEWRAWSYTAYFARVIAPPILVQSSWFQDFFSETIMVMGAGALLLMSILSFFIFLGKVPVSLVISFSLGSFFLSWFFIASTSSVFGIQWSMLTAHRLADIALWTGMTLFFYAYYKMGYLRLWSVGAFAAATMIGFFPILLGQTGDAVQLGTSIPFPFVILNLLLISYSCFAVKRGDESHWTRIRDSSNLLYVFICCHDIGVVLGLYDRPLALPVGMTAAIFAYALVVNQKIVATYQQRDQLLEQLEDKVAEKTSHLSRALENLKSTQAELIQSARLASLGTLSAGIAHEINNSINYVNGAVAPLEKRVMKHIPDGDKPMIAKLFGAVKEGTGFTVEIVKGLRNYTGLNQAPCKDILFKESVDSVLSILKHRTRDHEMRVNIPEDLSLFTRSVSLNQILMNLVSNALDASRESRGAIEISAKSVDQDVEFVVKDHGSGIAEDKLDNIFDPFFTTKEVGKGTGLGLYIVRREVENLGGTIRVSSEPGVGTEFVVRIPPMLESDILTEKKEAA